MYIHEQIVLLEAKQRMEDALRYAEQMRALRSARSPRPPARIRLGMALIRIGHRLMGRSSPAPGTAIGLGAKDGRLRTLQDG